MEKENVRECVQAEPASADGAALVATVANEKMPRSEGELVGGVGADDGGNDGEVSGVAEVGTPSDGVKEDEREDTGLYENEDKKESDPESSTTGGGRVVEGGRTGWMIGGRGRVGHRGHELNNFNAEEEPQRDEGDMTEPLGRM